MRSDLRGARLLRALALALLLGACKGEAPSASPAPVPERFAGVKKSGAQTATSFCEKSYPAQGAQARRYEAPALRPLPGEAPPTPAGRWRWVNLWATWCTPCVEEMALLRRWRDGFTREGLNVAFELLSIDAPSEEKALAAWKDRDLPGPIRWIRSEEEVEPLLASLGVAAGASIPIHALVDPSGQLRCVRVGAIHEQDYGAAKALLAN